MAEQVEATKTLMPAALAEFEVLADEPVTVSRLEACELDLAYVKGVSWCVFTCGPSAADLPNVRNWGVPCVLV